MNDTIRIEYIPDSGFQIGTAIFIWNQKRNSVRELLNNEHTIDDKVIEMAAFFDGDKSHDIEQRRDIYENIAGKTNYFFLNYDKDDHLIELEVHAGIEIIVKKVKLNFRTDINEFIKKLEDIGESYIETEEGNYLFENLKMTIANSESMGGDGNELTYFYGAKNVEHLIEK